MQEFIPVAKVTTKRGKPALLLKAQCGCEVAIIDNLFVFQPTQFRACAEHQKQYKRLLSK